MSKQKDAGLQRDYLDAMELVAKHLRGTPERATEVLSKFAGELAEKPGPEFTELRILALLTLCQVQARTQSVESNQNRQEAISILDRITARGNKLNIQDGLADLLIEIGEYRRAIGPCEQAIKLSRGSNSKVARRLWRAGRTYLRAGFREHAEEPLRKALDIFRAANGDPHTPVILNDLGNALRRSNPAAAEASYREAAAIWESAGAPAQAAVAWVNLGIVCGAQGRLQESLEWYEKVRGVRQSDSSTPRERLGSLANNVANLHRRMKNFDLAEREVEQAIALLDGDPLLADAYGTRALILRDQGLDEASLEWFRKARAEHARQPSPDVTQLTEALVNETAILRRLGRSADASALEEQLAALQGDRPPQYKHDVAPPARPVKPSHTTDGEVRIELDGIHLPDSVYRECDLATLENRLEEALETDEVGELDGHETGPENTTVFLFGADAEALFRAVEPQLRDYPLCQGARVTIRQGDEEREVVLS